MKRLACLLMAVLCQISWPDRYALAQPAYPDRPIRIIVPFPAGGAVDLIARLVSARIAEAEGWAFVIENKAGAGGVIATDATAKATPDGYTILLTTPSHTINGALKAKLPFDTEKDLVPIAVVADVPMLLVSPASAPFDSFASFVAYARQNPGKLNYSSAGNGTLPHVSMELILKLAGLQVVHVPYRGAAPALTDTVAGVVQLKFDTYATARELMAAGKLRGLAFASLSRSALMPDLPTVAEMGFPGYEGVLWNGFVAPAGVPAAVIYRLQVATAKAVRSEALAARLRREGIEPIGGTAAEFAARIAKEIAQWRELARTVKIAVD